MECKGIDHSQCVPPCLPYTDCRIASQHHSIGNASSYLRVNANVDRLFIIVCAAAALFALHDRLCPAVHGDIKASNILIDDDGNALLSDFGLSRIYNTQRFTTTGSIAGSVRWMASELFCCESDENDMYEKVLAPTASDIRSFGMIILEILTGEVPFAGYPDRVVPLQVINHKACLLRPSNPEISDILWILLERCLEHDPCTRPDARHVGLALDILYGLGEKHIDMDQRAVSSILDGVLDSVIPKRFPTRWGTDISVSMQVDALPTGI